MAHRTPLVGAIGMAAALAFSYPAQAAPTTLAPGPTAPSIHFNASQTSAFDIEGDTAEWRRRCGWRGCFRRGWRGRRGIRGGDLLAGALVIGGIAAIASAANNNRRRDREVVVVERDRRVDDERRYDDRRFDDRRSNPRSSGGSGIDSAVSQCLREIERDVRVESVDGASRISSGWVVSGSIFDGSGFTCEIGNDGRISDISYGRFRGSDAGVPGDGRAAGQLSDDRYASARASMRGERFANAGERPAEPLVPLTADRLPAYPGGPLPGDE